MKSPYLRADKILNDLIKEAKRLADIHRDERSLCDELEGLAHEMRVYMKTQDLRSANKGVAAQIGYYLIRMEEIHERRNHNAKVSRDPV